MFMERIRQFAGPGGAYTRGKWLIRAGRLTEALEVFVLAERLWREELGPNHPYIANALAYKAWCEVKLGDAEAGSRDYHEAAAIATQFGGAGHPRTLQLLRHLEWARQRTADDDVDSLDPPHIPNGRTPKWAAE